MTDTDFWIVSWMELTDWLTAALPSSRRIAQNYWHICNKRERRENIKSNVAYLTNWFLLSDADREREHAFFPDNNLSLFHPNKIVHENRRSYRQFIECLPAAHSTFNHFRSIIFQHATSSPHSRSLSSHLWCWHDIMCVRSVLNLPSFTICEMIKEKEMQRGESEFVCEYKNAT